MLHTGEQRMDSILKGSLWELVRPLLSPDVVHGPASSDSSVLEHRGEIWTVWCLLPLFIKDGSEW